MPLFKFIKDQFLIKNIPKASDIVVSKKAHKISSALLTVGIFLLFFSFVVALFKALSFHGEKLKVDEFIFSLLMLSVVITLISAIKTLISLINAHLNYLRGIKVSKLKIFSATITSLTFSIYMAFFSLNELYLLGKYNDGVHEDACRVYLTNVLKTDYCIDYEESNKNETSPMSRVLFFLN